MTTENKKLAEEIFEEKYPQTSKYLKEKYPIKYQCIIEAMEQYHQAKLKVALIKFVKERNLLNEYSEKYIENIIDEYLKFDLPQE